MARARIAILEGADVWLPAQLRGPDGELLEEADVTAWHLRIFQQGGDDAPVWEDPDNGTAGVWFDPPVVDGFWRKDSTGYNFRARLLWSDWQGEGGSTYLVELDFETAAWGTIPGETVEVYVAARRGAGV